jgi:hypothetical protein
MVSMNFQESVQKRAFELFLERGGVHGNDQDDWFRAENELRSKQPKGKTEIRSGGTADRKRKF